MMRLLIALLCLTLCATTYGQMELEAGTEYITVLAADAPDLRGTTAYTICAIVTPYNVTGVKTIFQIGDGSGNHEIWLVLNGSQVLFSTYEGGYGQVLLNNVARGHGRAGVIATRTTATTTNANLYAFDTWDTIGLEQFQTNGTVRDVTSATTVYLGARDGAAPWNGILHRVTVYPYRISFDEARSWWLSGGTIDPPYGEPLFDFRGPGVATETTYNGATLAVDRLSKQRYTPRSGVKTVADQLPERPRRD